MSTSTAPSPFAVRLPVRFFVLSVTTAALVAFGMGCAARRLLVIDRNAALAINEEHIHRRSGLPPPAVKGRKNIPQTVYTTKNFDTSRSVSSSLFLQIRPDDGEPTPITNVDKNEVPVTTTSSGNNITSPSVPGSISDSQIHDTKDGVNDEEVHLPAGQHLLVDFNNVDGDFLNSETRLAVAMVEMVYECGLTMLSYHCHQLFPSGVSCAGVLLESHVSFHTWPEEGVITLDLFTCGATSLLPMMPMIQSLFGLPRPGHAQKPEMLWAYKRRGFTDLDGSGNKPEQTDLFSYPIGSRSLEMKKEVVSVETDRHRIRIYDVIQAPVQSLAAYDRSLAVPGSYEARNSDLFRPDRLVFVDGVILTRRSRDAASHEALVHPAMFSHANPTRIALIGGGTDGGAALREVLKHTTVQRVSVLVDEPTLIDVAREHMAEWNDCSNIVGSAPSCFDDRRVQMVEDMTGDKHDVMVIDALDMKLNDREGFFQTVHRSLSVDGVVVIHTQKDTTADDLPISPSRTLKTNERYGADLAKLVQDLEEAGFAATRSYDENQDGYAKTRSYLIAFKSTVGLQRWDRTEPQVRLDMARRTAKARNGAHMFRYFDGASMIAYRETQNGERILQSTFKKARDAIKPRPDVSILTSSSSTTGAKNIEKDVDSNVSVPGNRRVGSLSELLQVQPFMSSMESHPPDCASASTPVLPLM